MKILFLTHAFNGLAQRLYVELAALGGRTRLSGVDVQALVQA